MGEIEDAISAAFESIEAEGQKFIVEHNLLPLMEVNKQNIRTPADRMLLAYLGFRFGEPFDTLLTRVELPNGWKYTARPDHKMWSNITDAEGLVRLRVFYKAAPYDRHAHFFYYTRDEALACLKEEQEMEEADRQAERQAAEAEREKEESEKGDKSNTYWEEKR